MWGETAGAVWDGAFERGGWGPRSKGNTTIIYLQYGSKYSNYYVIIFYIEN